jgi:hypothetical protein
MRSSIVAAFAAEATRTNASAAIILCIGRSY